MGRTVLAEADRVVGVDKNGGRLHQRRHAHGIARILHKHQESGAVGLEATVQGDAVRNGGHTKLAHTVINIITAGVFSGDAFTAAPDGQVGTGQVS